MLNHALTRRNFLAGAAGVATAAACVTAAGFAPHDKALAADKGTTRTVNALCGACTAHCGFTAYVKDGKLDKTIGNTNHPASRGCLCAVGYGYTQLAYSKDRLTGPMKKNDKGTFEKISWDQAISEISEKTKNIVASNGAGSIAAVYGNDATSKYYLTRFMNALGSKNAYASCTAGNVARAAGTSQAIGFADYLADVESARMVVLLGANYLESGVPAKVKALQHAHDNGATILYVDPRCGNTATFADEWIPINPGSDLALVLALSNVLVNRGLYDKDYVAENATGFADYAAAISAYTPDWASPITGISATEIETIASKLASNAPACCIELPGNEQLDGGYENSGETARAVALLHTLLGCWNEKGGAIIASSVQPGTLDAATFPSVPTVATGAVGSKDFPLASETDASSSTAIAGITAGQITGLFLYRTNVAALAANQESLEKVFDKLHLLVVIDTQMNETAELAHYVLPCTTELESMGLPEFIGGINPAVALSDAVIDKVEAEAKPIDEIVCDLAAGIGVEKYFGFSLEELADAQLRSVGYTLEALRDAGIASFPQASFTDYGTAPSWKTPSGKVQFTSDACEQAKLSAAPSWIAPAVAVYTEENTTDTDIDAASTASASTKKEDEATLRLISGPQAIQADTSTVDIAQLTDIAKKYHLESLWINASVAKRLGISDGDTVQVSNDLHTATVRAKVTERINDLCVFLPIHYGTTATSLKEAYGVGLQPARFRSFAQEPAYGSGMSQEALVTIRKVGA